MEKILERPLGEILVTRGLVSEAQRMEALLLQEKRGGRMGDIAIGQGWLGYLDLYRALAEQHALPFIDLIKEPPDKTLLAPALAENYIRFGAIPWRKENGAIIFAVSEISEETLLWIRAHFTGEIKLAVTSPFDIRKVVEVQFGKTLEEQSTFSLWKNTPQVSARETFTPRQRQYFTGFSLIGAALIINWPLACLLAFVALCHVAFAVSMIFKGTIFVLGKHRVSEARWKRRLARLDDRTLPIYTVMVPMYREAASLPRMLACLSALDYPPEKLDIKLVLEQDDEETLAAARALKPGYRFEIIPLPEGFLRTKPKACNYALTFARGDYVTIFDADDRPDPLQLKKAVYMFGALPSDVGCLQARLNYYNFADNMLTRCFALEYHMLFDYMMNGLSRLRLPLPLGGTSNHIALSRLRELGQWDPFNVTEDADLGVRLSSLGLRTVMLDSTTFEEAPNRYKSWITQRSRWIKGYMQTWLVHMRNPRGLLRALGWRGFLGFQLFFILPSVVFLTAPVVWVVTMLWAHHWLFSDAFYFPVWLAWLTGINLTLNMVTQCGMAYVCALTYKEQKIRMFPAAILFPAYTALHTLASYKALYQLIKRPHYWEKTEHGLGKSG